MREKVTERGEVTGRPPDGRSAPEAGEETPDGYNAGYAELLYERALRARGLVPASLAPAPPVAPAPARPPPAAAPGRGTAPHEQLCLTAAAGALVESYRDHGHLAARLDPLGSPPPGHPLLTPDFHGVDRRELAGIPASAIGLERLGPTVDVVLRRLEEIYCGRRIGYELDHLEDPGQRQWLIDLIESDGHWKRLTGEAARSLLERLTEVEGLERYLHRSYLGKKRFSLEGLEMLVPVLDEILERAVGEGTRSVFVGMAHRGRLNVLAHILGLSYESILAEFEEMASRGIQTALPETGSGDVKYHVGSRGTVRTGGAEVELHLAPNPSHLEHVNPVVEGMARAARGEGDRRSVLPLLIHGDAAFPGQGVVAETLNLCRLEAYETGGTIHVIANNQLGFTTPPEQGRSTRYASDLALGFRIPVFHVNADDPEACLAAARLAVQFRSAFGEDVVLDLVGYRRWGHNEGDEPGYTQPRMYERIARHPSVRMRLAERLVREGVLPEDASREMESSVTDRLARAREAVLHPEKTDPAVAEEREKPRRPLGSGRVPRLTGGDGGDEVETAVGEARLRELNARLHTWPDGFELFQKLGRQLERRREALETEIDWAHAEALAFASLLADGVPIRLTGEDTERGTFSQRHLVLHDARGEGTYVPLRHVAEDQASFHVWNSSLSEVSCLGFEYGFSTIATDWLVLWEAQFGDFVNVGQAIVDQFIVAGRSKWGQESRLVLLLPHGYEGQGPEHSSARLERFLQLAAEGNLRVANCTTPAQYFHLLRLQALRPARRPLVLMTPKSLLRHPRARSPLGALSGGGFRPVLEEETSPVAPERVTRLLLCSGKVYYDLSGAEAYEGAEDAVLVRLERLYPFPWAELRAVVGRFPALEEIRWVQEEPSNAGAWAFVSPWLRAVAGESRVVRYVGRPERASPAEGYAARHARRQAEIVEEALGR
ncbi:MAG: 2-oxoglutarate dehydrogenase E1 component [Gemmatimonadota bacterium]